MVIGLSAESICGDIWASILDDEGMFGEIRYCALNFSAISLKRSVNMKIGTQCVHVCTAAI